MNIAPFSFENHSVRIVTDDAGDPWFNAADVCDALGYANSRDTLAKHVDAEDVAKRDTLTSGGVQQQNYVNESGLYALIFGSTKEEAKRFKRWVTAEVLPALRKTGEYKAEPPKAKSKEEDTISAIYLIRDYMSRVPGVKAAMLESATLDCIKLNTGVDVEPLRKMLPAVEGRVCNLNATAVGKAVGLGAVKANQRLADLGLQERGGSGQWELTEEGRQYGEAIPYTNRGHSGYQILWSAEAVQMLR